MELCHSRHFIAANEQVWLITLTESLIYLLYGCPEVLSGRRVFKLIKDEKVIVVVGYNSPLPRQNVCQEEIVPQANL